MILPPLFFLRHTITHQFLEHHPCSYNVDWHDEEEASKIAHRRRIAIIICLVILFLLLCLAIALCIRYRKQKGEWLWYHIFKYLDNKRKSWLGKDDENG